MELPLKLSPACKGKVDGDGVCRRSTLTRWAISRPTKYKEEAGYIRCQEGSNDDAHRCTDVSQASSLAEIVF